MPHRTRHTATHHLTVLGTDITVAVTAVYEPAHAAPRDPGGNYVGVEEKACLDEFVSVRVVDDVTGKPVGPCIFELLDEERIAELTEAWLCAEDAAGDDDEREDDHDDFDPIPDEDEAAGFVGVER